MSAFPTSPSKKERSQTTTSGREDPTIERRIWIRSGIVEDLDQRQQRFLNLVLDKIQFYYRELYGTRPCYKYPLSLWRLAKLCNRGTCSVKKAVLYLAHSIPEDSPHAFPPISYDRAASTRNPSHRPYRIFLRKA